MKTGIYETPQIEVIEIEIEGTLCSSPQQETTNRSVDVANYSYGGEA